MTLYDKLVKAVGGRHNSRIREIVSVLDPKLEYNIKTTGNIAVFKNNVSKLTEETYNGFKNVNPSVIVLNGVGVMYPQMKFNGKLIIVLIKMRLVAEASKESKYENTIWIYEERSKDSFNLLGVK